MPSSSSDDGGPAASSSSSSLPFDQFGDVELKWETRGVSLESGTAGSVVVEGVVVNATCDSVRIKVRPRAGDACTSTEMFTEPVTANKFRFSLRITAPMNVGPILAEADIYICAYHNCFRLFRVRRVVYAMISISGPAHVSHRDLKTFRETLQHRKKEISQNNKEIAHYTNELQKAIQNLMNATTQGQAEYAMQVNMMSSAADELMKKM